MDPGLHRTVPEARKRQPTTPGSMTEAKEDTMYIKINRRLTGKNLRSLEILIGVDVAGRKGQIDPNDQQEQICAPPHD